MQVDDSATNNEMAMEPATPPTGGRRDSVENQEQYLLRNHNEIAQKLRLLIKNHVFITAVFNNGNQTLNTVIIDVIRDMDLIAMDYGPSQSLNEQLLNAGRIIFKASFDGIDVQFTATSITKAKYQGESVFAVPIPDEMLWVQRREFFRVRVPLGEPAICEIRQSDDSFREYKLYDISAGGLSIIDEYYDLEVEPGIVMSHCRLELPGHGNGKVNLEVRNIIPMKAGERQAGRRIGFTFHNMGMSFAATIQRYIHAVESARKRFDE
jgi:c-di-GMP-binding flagellar brake protein YcgR